MIRHLRPLLLGRPLHGDERHAPFFIVGSGRCGTTLMRAMLETHRAVHIPPGNPVLRAMLHDFRRYSRLPWSAVVRIVFGRLALHQSWESFELPAGPVFEELTELPAAGRNFAALIDAVYRAHLRHHKAGALRWGDKSPLSVLALDDLHSAFPDLRVIYMLRDGRDVAASFADAFGDDISRAAMVWVRAVRTAHDFRDRHPNLFLEVRYEDVARQPEQELRRVSDFLGLPFDERMLRHHEMGLKLGDVERTPYMQGVQSAVHQASIGRWRTAFDATQAATLERLLQPTLEQMGYGR